MYFTFLIWRIIWIELLFLKIGNIGRRCLVNEGKIIILVFDFLNLSDLLDKLSY